MSSRNTQSDGISEEPEPGNSTHAVPGRATLRTVSASGACGQQGGEVAELTNMLSSAIYK